MISFSFGFGHNGRKASPGDLLHYSFYVIFSDYATFIFMPKADPPGRNKHFLLAG